MFIEKSHAQDFPIWTLMTNYAGGVQQISTSSVCQVHTVETKKVFLKIGLT